MSRFNIGDKVWGLNFDKYIHTGKIKKIIHTIDGHPVKFQLDILDKSRSGSKLIELHHFDLYKRPEDKESLLKKLEHNMEIIKDSIEIVKEKINE